MERRYYYKSKDGKGLMNLKSPLPKAKLNEYVEITAEEFEALQPKPYVPTASELAIQEKKAEIASLKRKLSETDYVVIKIAEGSATFEEYADVIAQRRAARTRINALESELSA